MRGSRAIYPAKQFLQDGADQPGVLFPGGFRNAISAGAALVAVLSNASIAWINIGEGTSSIVYHNHKSYPIAPEVFHYQLYPLQLSLSIIATTCLFNRNWSLNLRIQICFLIYMIQNSLYPITLFMTARHYNFPLSSNEIIISLANVFSIIFMSLSVFSRWRNQKASLS